MQEKRNVFSWLRSLSRSKTETRATRIGVSNDASYMPPVSDYGVYVDNDSALKNTGFYAGILPIEDDGRKGFFLDILKGRPDNIISLCLHEISYIRVG